ncbi:hypothetical protein [Klebsiella aerogenes]|uniref:hypothetical protein n=1 Tax=Klebsiella aerogenes TaxID=548 RepID=UPI001BCC01C2|nr:hypothetical protein [Klebsiella aerogenes]
MSITAAVMNETGHHALLCIAMQAVKTYQERFSNAGAWKTMFFDQNAAETL